MRPFVEWKPGLRVLGHPLHAVLLHFPLTLWFLVFPLEAVAWIWRWDPGWVLAFYVNGAALLVALPTAMSGLYDWAFLRGEAAKSVGTRHMAAMLLAFGLFGIELLVRYGPEPRYDLHGLLCLGLSFLGTALLALGAWLGGELVYGHGVGVRAGKAPSEAARP